MGTDAIIDVVLALVATLMGWALGYYQGSEMASAIWKKSMTRLADDMTKLHLTELANLRARSGR